MSTSNVKPNQGEPEVGYLWDQWPDEGPGVYEDFCTYLHLPVRSIRAVCRTVQKDYGTLRETAKRWQWERRAKAYDDTIRMEIVEKNRRAIVRMRDRHAKAAQKLHAIVAKAVEAKIESLESMDPTEMDLLAIARVMDLAQKMERLSRGEPETVTRVEHSDADGGGADPRDHLARLLDGIRERAGAGGVDPEPQPPGGPGPGPQLGVLGAPEPA